MGVTRGGEQRILHVEPDPRVRRALRDGLLMSPYDLAGECVHPAGVMAQYLSLKPDFVLIDAGIGKKTGGTWSGGLIKEIKQENPFAKLLVSYEPEEAGLVFDALRLGAVEYVRKPLTTLRVMDALINAQLASSRNASSRRQQGRLRAGLVVAYRKVPAGWLARLFHADDGRRTRSVDISMAGICLQLRDGRLDAGDLLDLKIELDAGHSLECRGTVRYVRRDQNRLVCGVQFAPLPEKKAQVLQQALINLLCRDYGR